MTRIFLALMVLCPTLVWAGSNSVLNFGNTSIPTTSTPPTSGQSLIYNGTGITGGAASGTATALSFGGTTINTTSTPPTNGQGLIYNGVGFTGGNISGGGVTAPTRAGNPTIYPGTTASVASLPDEVHTSGYATLAATVAACPASPTPCKVVADPGSYTIGNTPLVIGSTTQSVTLVCDHSTITCTGTAGADCIDIGLHGDLEGHGSGIASNNTGCVINTNGTTNVTSLVANAAQNQAGFQMHDVFLTSGGTATVTKGLVWMNEETGFARMFNVSINGVPANSIGMLVDDGTAGLGQWNDITCIECIVTVGNAAGTVGVKLGATNNHGGSNFTWYGGSIVDAGNTGTTLLKIDGNTGGTIDSVTYQGIYLESTTGQTGDFVDINNAKNINLLGVKFNGGPELTSCVGITGSGSNIGQIIVTGRAKGTQCVNVINNAVSGQLTGAGAGDFSYYWPGGNGTGMLFDGAGPTLSGANITAATIPTGSLAVVQGNGTKVQLGTGTLTSGHCLQADANANVVDSGTVGCGGAAASPFVQAMTAGTGLSLYGGL